MRRFEFVDSTSNKFWEVEVKGKTLNVTFGKIGTKGQSKPKDFATPEKAKAEMEKLIKEKTGKGYVEVGDKAVKAIKPAAGKKASAGSVGKGLSKAEKQAKAEKVLAMFAGGQLELARGILEAAQDEHWLFEELLKGCKIEDGIPIPSVKIMDAFGEEETSEGHWDDEEHFEVSQVRPVKSELVMLEMLLHLPKDLKKLQKLPGELGIKLKAEMLSKYWKEVVRGRGEFEGVKLGDPENFTDQWYEARKAEIAKIEKECEARSKSFNKPWKEEEDLGQGVKLVMVLIPAGKFVMGSEMGHFENETQHEVTLTKSYYMGKYAVTQEQWKAVMGKNPSDTKGAKLPVTDVSWNDCKKFVKKLNGITKGKYRLPTEAEWEYACRAGTSTAYSFGDEITPKDANYDDSKLGKPVEVGSYKPNAFGLCDMHGNVWEWCEDWYGDYPKGAVIDPKGPAKGEYRVLRGGSFGGSFRYRLLCEVNGEFLEDLVRSSCRNNTRFSPGHKFNNFGFRLARTI
jgi:formylglycine-generating enzyme required for sulfatase activity/predicted DNA-binding WGR domain protein